jgi:hypothetical protein
MPARNFSSAWTERCTNCNAFVPPRAVRCVECGKSLRPTIAFDLSEDEATHIAPDAPTRTGSVVGDRILGATTPFLLSLLWVGGLWLVGVWLVGRSTPETVVTNSLTSFPLLRVVLPLVAQNTLRTRYPWVSEGFKNALLVAVSLAVSLALGLFISLLVFFFGAMGPIIANFGADLSRACSFNSTVPQHEPLPPLHTFALTPGLVVSTLLLQGMLAALMPVSIRREDGQVRVSQAARSVPYKMAVGFVALLSLRWWIPVDFVLVRVVLSLLAGMGIVYLSFRSVQESRVLTTRGKQGLTAVVCLCGAIVLLCAWF